MPSLIRVYVEHIPELEWGYIGPPVGCFTAEIFPKWYFDLKFARLENVVPEKYETQVSVSGEITTIQTLPDTAALKTIQYKVSAPLNDFFSPLLRLGTTDEYYVIPMLKFLYSFGRKVFIFNPDTMRVYHGLITLLHGTAFVHQNWRINDEMYFNVNIVNYDTYQGVGKVNLQDIFDSGDTFPVSPDPDDYFYLVDTNVCKMYQYRGTSIGTPPFTGDPPEFNWEYEWVELNSKQVRAAVLENFDLLADTTWFAIGATTY